MNQSISPEMTMASIASCRPDAAPLLERLGFDWCCGGQATLLEQCRRLRLDVSTVIQAVEHGSEAAATPDAGRATGRLCSVCDQLEHSQFGALQLLLTRTVELSRRVSAAHGASKPEMPRLEQALGEFAAGAHAHVVEMQNRLLPMIRRNDGGAPSIPSELSAKIADASAFHADARRLLFRMRELTDAFTAPPDACGSWLLLLQLLGELEAGTSACIRTERDVLFPMAVAAHARIRDTGA